MPDPSEPAARVFYRVVKTDPPALADFTSPASAGKTFVHPDPDRRRLWAGVSFFATEAQARRSARRYQTQGQYVAAVRVKAGGPIRFERTLGPGHYTLWGEPAELLARVESVVPVG